VGSGGFDVLGVGRGGVCGVCKVRGTLVLEVGGWRPSVAGLAVLRLVVLQGSR
jgi:hypothetical protein